MSIGSGRVAILGGRGFVRGSLQKGVGELLREVGDNTGNMVFQRAASALVDNDQLFVGPGADIHQDLTRLHAECKAVIFPAANHIDVRNDLGALSRWLAGMKLPLVVLGIGTQASDCSAATLDALTTRFAGNDGFRDLMATFRSTNVFVGVRGAFTQALLQRFDVPAAVTGCPSFLMNMNLDLGLLIERRFARVKERLRTKRDCRLAVTATSPWSDGAEMATERCLIAWLVEQGGLYVQQSGGEDAIRIATKRFANSEEFSKVSAWYRKRLDPELAEADFDRLVSQAMTTYFSVDGWRDALSACDLSIGTRYHGNALAMQCGVPSVTVVHDSRTVELCQSTGMPSVNRDEVLKARSLVDLLAGVTFDGHQYDVQRRIAACTVREALVRAGVQPTEHLTLLSEAWVPDMSAA